MLADYRRLMRSWHDREDAMPQSLRRSLDSGRCGHDADIEAMFAQAQANLVAELLSRIHAREPAFFEALVIDVLLAMGYGSRRRDLSRRLGRSGDGGVDGLISQDELGLDQIYLQAKRLRPGTVVPVSEVRDFAGSLDAHHAAKGVFLTTSHFSPSAIVFCQHVSRRVVLVDGDKFATLMVRYNIGVSVRQSYQVKRIDPDYFRREVPAAQEPR